MTTTDLPFTRTHYCAAGVDLGWPRNRGTVVVDLWVPHMQDPPAAWVERLLSGVGRCDSCGAHPPLAYSPPHDAYFCRGCHERENS